jgi:hypothetical protein
MGFMSIKEMMVDSLRYSSTDWKAVLRLGILLVILDLNDELLWAGNLADELKLLLNIVAVILFFLEAGYLFRILEETIEGSKKLPKFNKIREMFIHGVKEAFISFSYFLIPFMLFVLFFFNFMTSMDLDDVSGEKALTFLVILAITALIYILFPAVLLNMGHNHGTIRSAFDFRKIFRKIRVVGFKRLVLVYMGIFIIISLIKLFLDDGLSTSIPFIGDFISNLIITPFVVIFTTRFLGLIDIP